MLNPGFSLHNHRTFSQKFALGMRAVQRRQSLPQEAAFVWSASRRIIDSAEYCCTLEQWIQDRARPSSAPKAPRRQLSSSWPVHGRRESHSRNQDRYVPLARLIDSLMDIKESQGLCAFTSHIFDAMTADEIFLAMTGRFM